MKNSDTSSGGYWMLVGLVGLLVAPIAVHHIMNPAATEPSVQASVISPAVAKN